MFEFEALLRPLASGPTAPATEVELAAPVIPCWGLTSSRRVGCSMGKF